MANLYNINPESAYDGQQRSPEDIQFDLENVLTVGKLAEERNAASVILDILARTTNKTAAEVAADIVTAKPQWTEGAVRGACVRRAFVRVRERGLGPGCATSSTEVFQDSWSREKPLEDVWREWVKNVSKLPQGSLDSQAIEQLTISGLSHGQRELEKHLRLRAPLAWQDVQTQVEKYLSTVYHQQSPEPMDVSAVMTGSKCQSCGSQTHQRNDCWYKDGTSKICEKRGHLAKVCRSGRAQRQP